MKAVAPAFRLAGRIWAAGLVWTAAAEPPTAGPGLHFGDGGWAAVAQWPEGRPPPFPQWTFLDGLWVGRWPADAEEADWGEGRLRAAEALPVPLAPGYLPQVRNAYGACVVRSLSVRFDAQIRAHRWSLAFPPKGEASAFVPLRLEHGSPVAWTLWLEDAETGARWELRPERMGVEGGMFERQKGDSRLYAGMVDGGRIEWHAVVARSPRGRRIVQARVRTFDGAARLLRLRFMARAFGSVRAAVQAELPPALVDARGDGAVGLFADLAEPRRFRAVLEEPGQFGLEFDLAVTRSTGNFPRSASISVEMDAWPSSGAEYAAAEAAARLVRFGGTVPVPPEVRSGAADWRPIEPSLQALEHPGGFLGEADVLHALWLRMSGLFADHGWMASAFLCAAQDSAGRPRIAFDGDRAVVAVNPDPDLDTVLEMGQNRGLALLARVLAEGGGAVWLRALGGAESLDHHVRALRMCDYPAVWEEGTNAVGVDLRHAEAETIASLACVLRGRGVALLVGDAGPMAPFTTAYADALVCESAEPDEMARQSALAGGRPVFWRAVGAGPEAAALARDLGFASFR